MKHLLFLFLGLVGVANGQISTLTLPHVIDSALVPQVSYVDDNDAALRNKVNELVSAQNADSARTSFQSLTHLRLTIDADANATAQSLAITHNGSLDTLAVFGDDSTLYLPRLTASLPVFTTAGRRLTTNAMTGTGSVVMSASPTIVSPAITGNLVASGTLSGDSLISSKFYEENSFTGTLTGVTTTVTGTIRYLRIGKQVTIMVPALLGTSNSTAATITGMPAGIRPARAITCPGVVVDNSSSFTNMVTGFQIEISGTLTLYLGGVTTFTGSGVKGYYGNLDLGAQNAFGTCHYTLQ